jgi:hypothetical protein
MTPTDILNRIDVMRRRILGRTEWHRFPVMEHGQVAATLRFPTTGDIVGIIGRYDGSWLAADIEGNSAAWVLSLLEGKTRDDAGVMR